MVAQVEVNTSPSLSSSSPLDAKIKLEMMQGALNIVGLTPVDRRAYKREKERKEQVISHRVWEARNCMVIRPSRVWLIFSYNLYAGGAARHELLLGVWRGVAAQLRAVARQAVGGEGAARCVRI